MTDALRSTAERLTVDDLLGSAPALTGALREVPVDVATTVVVMHLEDTDGDPAQVWIVDAITKLIGWLGEAVGPSRPGLPEDERPSIVIVLSFAEAALEHHPHYCEAAAEGLRGVLQSLIAERGSELRCNLAIARGSDLDDLRDLVAFIASEGGRYMSGSRVDLRERGA